MPRLDGRIARVTGASRGLGAAVAKRLAAEGAHVILAARTQGGLEEVDDAIRQAGGKATLAPMDLRDFDKIDQMGVALQQRFKRLDVLAACAGFLGALSPVGHVDPRVWQEVMDVNLTANYRLIRALDPLLRQSESGRAIFTTCAQSSGFTPYWGVYAASKAALEALVKIYAGEVVQTTLKVNLADPGPVRTLLRATAFPHEDRAKLKKPDEVMEVFVRLAAADCPHHGEIVHA